MLVLDEYVNVSDRRTRWRHNVRCPDVAVYLKGNPARDCDTHWFGGPDFVAEVVMPRDRSREKSGFYAAVGVRELLIVDRLPWELDLFRLSGKELTPTETCSATKPRPFQSAVLPVRFSLAPGKSRPQIVVTRTTDGQTTRI
jgi:Uma2 family endonuclease